jgi:hypothetical protein
MKPLVSAARIAAAVAVLTASAVGSAGPPPRVVPYDEPRESVRQCPEVMRGVALVFRPITGGIAIEFSSPRQYQVPELRQQLREAAIVVEQHSKAPLPVSAIDEDPEAARIPPLDISVNDVGAGARVIIRARRARDIPEILELARALELFWLHSDCNEDVGTRRRIPLPYQSA